MTKPKTVEEYIKTAPEESQEKLQELRSLLQKILPNATVSLKWSQPAFSDETTILLIYGGFKKHIGFYITPSTFEKFKDQFTEYKTGAGSIQFPLDKPLPTDLITKIVEYRVWERKEKDVKWM
jgi:uncharacterized protein YdhG (YjbR/CyaY superfamily)